MTTQTYETILEIEEIISPEEFLARRKKGKILSENVKIIVPSEKLPFGAFSVKLDIPRYKATFEKSAINA